MTSAGSAGETGNTSSGEVPGSGYPSPPTAPPRPPAGPPPTAGPYPGAGSAASTQPIIGVGLRVSNRLLWIGDAYYPFQNITRVYTLTIHPRRKEAVLLFAKRLLLTGVVVTVLALIAAAIDASGRSRDGGEGDSPGLTVLVLIVAGAVLIHFLVEMLKVLGSPAYFVLAIETSGSSTAVVTSSHPDQLRRLAHQLADAIENPQVEFEVRVESLVINPAHYYFGDNVNMYGGTGNVGMAS